MLIVLTELFYFFFPFQHSSLLKKTRKAGYFDCIQILHCYFISFPPTQFHNEGHTAYAIVLQFVMNVKS